MLMLQQQETWGADKGWAQVCCPIIKLRKHRRRGPLPRCRRLPSYHPGKDEDNTIQENTAVHMLPAGEMPIKLLSLDDVVMSRRQNRPLNAKHYYSKELPDNWAAS